MPQLGVAFFATGFAALLCQVVWQRMLGLFAGSDTVSAAIVVGAFLTGLGLGSLLGARIADRLSRAHAIIGFALAEAGVAVFALFSRLFLYDGLAIGLAGLVDHQMAVFAICFAGLVVPTTLMGASLPLLSRAVATSLEFLPGRIARLYSLNTVGAGLGALVGGWVLLGELGFERTLWLAAFLELAAAGLALTLLPAMRRAPADAAPSAPAPAPGTAPPSTESLLYWCALVFASGFVIVALEILWVRVLGQFGQYHAYLFGTVLGVFLLADGLGMALGARMVGRLRDMRAAFFLAQGAGFVLAGALVLALWALVPHLAALGDAATWVDTSRLRGTMLLFTVAITVLVVGPPALVIGMTFAFVQRAVQSDLTQVGARVGWVQLANIAGNAAGSVGTGIVALHLAGTAGTLKLLALVSLALTLVWLLRRDARRNRWGWALAAGCAAIMALGPGNDAFWRRMHAEMPGQPVAWAEDRSGVAFFRNDDDEPTRQRPPPTRRPGNPLYIQGFSQGTIPFLPVHQFLGALGPLLHPDPRQVLVIGIGSGGTPWAAGVNPATQRVRAVELVAPVIPTLRAVAGMQPAGPIAHMFNDPRWLLEYGDGRRVLSHSTMRYDVIEADAILPQGSHSGMLYSAEFFAQVRAHLAPGGLAVQWAPTRRSLETFTAVFPHVVVLMPIAVMVGSNQPISYDRDRLLARFAEPAIADHLRRGAPECCNWARLIAGPPQIWTPDTPRLAAPLTDLFPRDEFYMNNWSSPARDR